MAATRWRRPGRRKKERPLAPPHLAALDALRPPPPATTSSATTSRLRRLQCAALALPMLAGSVAHASSLRGESALAAGRYDEGPRDLLGVTSAFDPIAVDWLEFEQSGTIAERHRFALRFAQDTWSGATPIATAPFALGGNHPSAPDGVSGATPLLEGSLFFGPGFEVLATDGFGSLTGAVDDRLVHTISGASPETRHTLELELGRDHARGETRLGGGFSLEPDYVSGFVEAGLTIELSKQRTTLDLDLGYAHDSIDATVDHDAAPYIDTSGFQGTRVIDVDGQQLQGTRDSLRARLGVTRLLDRRTRVGASIAYAYGWGLLADSYRAVEVAFLDPAQQFLAPPGGYYGEVHALSERRPDARGELVLAADVVRHIPRTDTALRLDLAYAHDDWGIDAGTLAFEVAQPLPLGLLVAPRLRYYTQGAADFYTPYLISPQAFRTVVVGPGGGISVEGWSPALLPASYSSDWRLAGYGTLAAGAGMGIALGRGIDLRFDFDWYAHRSAWQLGGAGSGDFGDFDAWTASGAVVVDLAALSLGRLDGAHAGHAGHQEAGAHAVMPPVGMTAAHMLEAPRRWSLGYRFGAAFASGAMWRSSTPQDDSTIVAKGCAPGACLATPDSMTMNMHMFELMFAPTRWLNLMIMPQYMDMEMSLRTLPGGENDLHAGHDRHASGGWGDLPIFALVRVLDRAGHHVHAAVGVSAPVGAVDLVYRRTHQEDRGYLHYEMQLGSGTWDLLPSVTYAGSHGRLGWGAQLSGIVRLEQSNDVGYALGDRIQADVWGGYAVLPWLTGTLRGRYAWQGAIRGAYTGPHSTSTPPDFPTNYGGLTWDLGIGLRATAPAGGLFAGQSLAVEWVQPLATHFGGFQLERTGTLVVGWQLGF